MFIQTGYIDSIVDADYEYIYFVGSATSPSACYIYKYSVNYNTFQEELANVRVYTLPLSPCLHVWLLICALFNKSSIWFVFNYEFLYRQLWEKLGKSKVCPSRHRLWLIWIIFGTRWNASEQLVIVPNSVWPAHSYCSTAPVLYIKYSSFILFAFCCQVKFIYLFVFLNFVWNIAGYAT